jgi:phosphoglycerate kinase
MKTLGDFNFKDKTVLLRSDLNSDVRKGRVIEGERIKASVETIKELKKKKAKVVVIAHQGNKGKSDFISLKGHVKLLNKYIKVRFVNGVVSSNALESIKELKMGEVLLLENIRFEKDELKPEKGKKNKLYKLVELADFYVNDAFSVCHRGHASIVLFPRYLKSFAGRLLEREVRALKKIEIKNCLYVLGGAKPEDNLKLLKGKRVLSCGLFAQSCLIAKGFDFGKQNKYLEREGVINNKLLIKLKKGLKNAETPVDFAVKIENKRREIGLKNFPSKYEIFDIGQNTIDKYVREIKKARAIYMKGPAGDCSRNEFCKGTFAILKAIASNKGFSIIGGGHLSDAIEKSRIDKKKFGHISLSGGALLNYIAGERLEGLEALK